MKTTMKALKTIGIVFNASMMMWLAIYAIYISIKYPNASNIVPTIMTLIALPVAIKPAYKLLKKALTWFVNFVWFVGHTQKYCVKNLKKAGE